MIFTIVFNRIKINDNHAIILKKIHSYISFGSKQYNGEGVKEEEAVMEKKLNHIVNDMNCGEFCKIMATT